MNKRQFKKTKTIHERNLELINKYLGDNNIKIIPQQETLRCVICNREITGTNQKEFDMAGIPPICSRYCSEVYNGIPMPWYGVQYQCILDKLERESKIRIESEKYL